MSDRSNDRLFPNGKTDGKTAPDSSASKDARTSQGPMAIEVAGLDFAYPGRDKALDDVRFQVPRGGHLALVGPNGSGKSTLLLHLSGLLPSARVRIMGQAASSRKARRRILRLTGLLFQDPDDQLFMPTAIEDVAFGPLQRGMAPDAARQRAQAALEEVGMAHLTNLPPHHLSGGEKRLVALAAVLACDPEILLLDEPTANLDPGSRRRFLEILAQQKARGTTILAATHDLDMAFETFDETLVLHRGQVKAQGPAVKILADEALMSQVGMEICLSVKLHFLQNKTTLIHGMR